MAERVLYGCSLDQEVDLSQLVDRLSWLPGFLAASEPSIPTCANYRETGLFGSLLSIVLVFGGARTATLQNASRIKSFRLLVRRLNSVLAKNEWTLHLDCVYRRGTLFITRTHSPRFDWSIRLTNIQIGRNLDYFAAGHMFNAPFPDRGWLFFIEKNTMAMISVEAILLESLSNLDFYNELVSFSNRKEQLMNETMQQLGLKYRFQWILNTPERTQALENFMKQSLLPPTDEWWESHFVEIDFPTAYVLRPHITYFARNQTRFREHWPLLRFLYFFSVKYVLSEYREINKYCDFDYWETIKTIFGEVELALITKEFDIHEATKYCEEIKTRLQPLITAADSFMAVRPEPSAFPELYLPWAFKLQRAFFDAWYWVEMAGEGVKICLFQRWKLRKPRIHVRPPLPPGTVDY